VLPAADNSWSNADELRQAPATSSISAGHYRQPAVFQCRLRFYGERVPTSDKRVVYLDSSALVKLVVRESESAALRRELRGEPERASCALARVEVVRAVRPHGAAAVVRARRLLRRLDLVQLDEELLDAAAVAKILGVSLQWIKDHTTRIEPIIPHIRLGRKIRFRSADIKRFIQMQTETRPRWERRTA